MPPRKHTGENNTQRIIRVFKQGADIVEHNEGWTGKVYDLLEKNFGDVVDRPQRQPKKIPPMPSARGEMKKVSLYYKTTVWLENILRHYFADKKTDWTAEDIKQLGPATEKIMKATLTYNSESTITKFVTEIRNIVESRYPEPSPQFDIIKDTKYFGAEEDVKKKNKKTKERTIRQQKNIKKMPVERAYEIIHNLKMRDEPVYDVLMVGLSCGARFGEILHADKSTFERASIKDAIKHDPDFAKNDGDKDKHDWIKQIGFEKRIKTGMKTAEKLYPKADSNYKKRENFLYRPLIGLKHDEFFERLENVRNYVKKFVEEHPKIAELSKTEKSQKLNYYSRISKTIFKQELNEALDKYFPEHATDSGDATENRSHSCRKLYVGLSYYEFGYYRDFSFDIWITEILGHSSQDIAANYTKYDFIAKKPTETKLTDELEQRLQQVENKIAETNERAETAQETALEAKRETEAEKKMIPQNDKPFDGPEITDEEIEKEIAQNWDGERKKWNSDKKKRTMRQKAIRCLATYEIITQNNMNDRTTTLRSLGMGSDLTKYYRTVIAFYKKAKPDSDKPEEKEEKEPEPEAEPDKPKSESKYKFPAGPELLAVKEKHIDKMISELWNEEEDRFDVIAHSKDKEKARYEKFVLIAAAIRKLLELNKIKAKTKGPSLRELIDVGLNRRHFDLFNKDRE